MTLINIKTSYFVTAITFLSIFSIGLIFLIFQGSHLFSINLNSISSNGADLFFKYITYFGDGIVAFSVVFICFFFRRDYAFTLLITLVFSTIITQILKRVIFIERLRPSAIFRDLINSGNWHLVDGVHLHEKYSFPSGHTATIFCLCILFSLLIKSKKLSISLVIFAFIVGFSRIYLSQHFLEDVMTGALIGTIIPFVVFYFIYPKIQK
jgi:membrane-associated phospholipid phosphatase